MPPQVPAGLPSSLLERRPDIRQVEQELVAANAEIGAARAEYFPRISLTGFLGIQSRSLSGLVTGGAGLWSAGLGAAAPIFNAGRTRPTSATPRRCSASWWCATSAPSTSRCAKSRTRSPAIARPRDQRTEQQQLVETLEASTRLSRQRYEGGVDNFLQLLDARRNLFQGELDLARLRQQELASIVQLYRALGGGWSKTDAAAEVRGAGVVGRHHTDHEEGDSMFKRMILMLALMALVLAGLGVVKFQQIQTAMAQGAAFQPPPEAVTTIVAQQEEWPATLSAIGTMAAVQGVTVSADLPGTSSASRSSPAARCAQGDVLAELDTRQERRSSPRSRRSASWRGSTSTACRAC